MTIKDINSEGVKYEFTWAAQVKGSGKAQGLDGTVFFTATVVVSPAGIASSLGNGIFSTMTGDQAIIKSAGSGIGEGDQGKGVSVWSFMTTSMKLTWLNKTVAIMAQQGDSQESDVVVWEWI